MHDTLDWLRGVTVPKHEFGRTSFLQGRLELKRGHFQPHRHGWVKEGTMSALHVQTEKYDTIWLVG